MAYFNRARVYRNQGEWQDAPAVAIAIIMMSVVTPPSVILVVSLEPLS